MTTRSSTLSVRHLVSGICIRATRGPLPTCRRPYASASSSRSWDVEPVDLSYDVVEPPKPDSGAKGQSLVICHGLLCVPPLLLRGLHLGWSVKLKPRQWVQAELEVSRQDVRSTAGYAGVYRREWASCCASLICFELMNPGSTESRRFTACRTTHVLRHGSRPSSLHGATKPKFRCQPRRTQHVSASYLLQLPQARILIVKGRQGGHGVRAEPGSQRAITHFGQC